MDFILEGFAKAIRLIATGDPQAMGILWFTLRVSITAILIASMIGLPAGCALAMGRFRGRGLVIAVCNTLMSLPTVTVGLLVYALLTRHGPLGGMNLLFTPAAIVIGEVVLVLPIITALVCAAVGNVDEAVRKTALTLGASEGQAMYEVVRESRAAIGAALAAGFGRAVAEVGAAMMLGGNIRGYTRTLTTAIAFETGKGEFAFSVALGILLLLLAFAVTGLFHLLQKRI